MAVSGGRGEARGGREHFIVMAIVLGMFRRGRDGHARHRSLGVSGTFCHNTVCLHIIEADLGLERPRGLRGGGLGRRIGWRF